jgi:uncharacterized membrane protein/predicted DsbA family dithiol-disulfide isomerase
MSEPLAAPVRSWLRPLSFLAGLGMTVFSALTIQHYFAANYPETIFAGSFCDINAFFNCDSSARSPIAQLGGVPIGYFGLMVGALVMLGAAFPSDRLTRVNRSLALATAAGAIGLGLFSVLYHGTLCLLCSGFYVSSWVSLWVFWRAGRSSGAPLGGPWLRPSVSVVLAAAVVVAGGAWSMRLYHDARRDAQLGGAATRVVRQFYALDRVAWPSVISPYWIVKSTERFEDAPIRIVAFEDLLCPDCKLLADQIAQLDQEFSGQMNVVFQFFPLEGACNQVVDKDLHPGACELSYLAAHDPEKFKAIYTEVFANLRDARDPEWRAELARRHGVEAGLTDARTHERVRQLIGTGAEYAPTSGKYAHGIRSTPTMIINGRMVIGTLPYEQMRALFGALVDEAATGTGFLEQWVPARERGRESGPPRR